MIGISRSTIYDWLNPKSPRYNVTFPKQRRLGMHSVGWMESEIDKWLEECGPQV
ncbi:MAG: AlpA family phage regulatory protein [Hafnia sp.]